jgi:hypothetical protein
MRTHHCFGRTVFTVGALSQAMLVLLLLLQGQGSHGSGDSHADPNSNPSLPDSGRCCLLDPSSSLLVQPARDAILTLGVDIAWVAVHAFCRNARDDTQCMTRSVSGSQQQWQSGNPQHASL